MTKCLLIGIWYTICKLNTYSKFLENLRKFKRLKTVSIVRPFEGSVGTLCQVNTTCAFSCRLKAEPNICCGNTGTGLLHPLTAEVFRFKERQGDEVHIIVTYGQMGCKGSGGATELSVVLHPVQLDPRICRRSCYRAHALGDCPARWPRPNDVASWTHSDPIVTQNPNMQLAELQKLRKENMMGPLKNEREQRTTKGSEDELVSSGIRGLAPDQRWKLKVRRTETMRSNPRTVGQWERLPCNNQALTPVGGAVPGPVPVCVCLGPQRPVTEPRHFQRANDAKGSGTRLQCAHGAAPSAQSARIPG